MASKKRKASEKECTISPKKRIKHPLASSTPSSVPGSSRTISSICNEDSSESLSTNSSYKFSDSTDAAQSFSDAFESAKESVEMELPESVSVLKFAECRADEISSLMHAVESKQPKLSFQQLPHYMRRRATSHNANRVPRRLREKVLKEIEDAKRPKRPSRKHRRRPSNLLQEYNRRQREHVWLETHIWFAKRFKMTKLWGYKLPLHPNDQSAKAGFRASSRHVLIQDLSYMCCIELVGLQQTLLQKLSQLTDISTGLTFASKMCLTGTREGHLTLYNSLTFPYRPLGHVSFLWCPYSANSSNQDLRKLWIWCHPAMHEELVDVLKTIFDLPSNEDEQQSQKDVENIKESNEDASEVKIASMPSQKEEIIKCLNGDSQLKAENEIYLPALDKKLSIRFKRTTCYSNEDVTLNLLKNTLVRHRLIGPLSHAVIIDALKPADVQCGIEPVTASVKWWESFFRDEKNRAAYREQKAFWTRMQDWRCPDEAPPKVVLGLTVKDPRLDLPKIRKNISCEFDDHKRVNGEANFNVDVSYSPIWDEAIRNETTASKLPENQLNKQRSNFLIPGTRLELGRDESRIPVMAIQQPGVNGYSSGWDIIAPLGWSMAFWIAFVYRGARAFGLRELRGISREAGVPLFPFNCPDTKSGQDWEETNRKALITKHFRYPPKKRPSFQKLGILTPFFMPWDTLVSNWIDELSKQNGSSTEPNDPDVPEIHKSRNYFILRAKKELRQLTEICELLTKLSTQRHRNIKWFNTIKAHLEEFRIKLHDSELKNALVCIKLTCSNRGNPSEYSGVYMPIDSDLLTLKENPAYGGPTEPKHSVPKIKGNKLTKRKKSKDSAQSAENKNTENEEDSRLQRPHIENLIDHCSRQLMGLIEVGNYSQLKGCGTGLGHCSLVAILELFRKCLEVNTKAAILVRSQNGFQYRFMYVNICSC